MNAVGITVVAKRQIVGFDPWFPGREITQDADALGASTATVELYEYICRAAKGDVCISKAVKVMEVGSGSGILSLMLALGRPGWQITGIDIQPHLCEIARENADRLGIGVHFVTADLRGYLAEEPLDLIVSNPPWQKLGTGKISPLASRAISRTEMCCTMEDVLAFCDRNLKVGGEAIIAYPSEREHELRDACGGAFQVITAANGDVCSSRGKAKRMIFHIVKGCKL